MEVTIRSSFAVGSTKHLAQSSRLGREARVELPDGATVLDLLETLPSIGPREQFDDMMITVFVNGKLCGFDHRLRHGDLIDIHIPVSGG